MFHQRPGKPAFQTPLQEGQRGGGAGGALTCLHPSSPSGLKLRRFLSTDPAVALVAWIQAVGTHVVGRREVFLISTVATSSTRSLEPLTSFTLTEQALKS